MQVSQFQSSLVAPHCTPYLGPWNASGKNRVEPTDNPFWSARRVMRMPASHSPVMVKLPTKPSHELNVMAGLSLGPV